VSHLNILLDLDGTLTDPADGIVACFRHALEGYGVPCPSDDELKRFIGPPLRSSFESILGDDTPAISAAIARYRERFSVTGLFENRTYPGITAMLETLRGCGARLFLATSKPTVYATRIVEHFALRPYLHGIYGSELDGTRADKAELIAHLVERESIALEGTWMVGDRSHDVRAAAQSGINSLAVLWGYGTREELVNAGATVLVETPGEVAAFFTRLSTQRGVA
jgi:phosphoglycolate phosphatase